MNYGLKNTLNFEGTEKKGDDEKNSSLTQVKGEERKSSRQLNRTLWCVGCTMWALYL